MLWNCNQESEDSELARRHGTDHIITNKAGGIISSSKCIFIQHEYLTGTRHIPSIYTGISYLFCRHFAGLPGLPSASGCLGPGLSADPFHVGYWKSSNSWLGRWGLPKFHSQSFTNSFELCLVGALEKSLSPFNLQIYFQPYNSPPSPSNPLLNHTSGCSLAHPVPGSHAHRRTQEKGLQECSSLGYSVKGPRRSLLYRSRQARFPRLNPVLGLGFDGVV